MGGEERPSEPKVSWSPAITQQSSDANARASFWSKLSLRQSVVVIVLLYLAATAVFVGKNNKPPQTGAPPTGDGEEDLLLQTGPRQRLNSLAEEDVPALDDAANASGIEIIAAAGEQGTLAEEDGTSANDLYQELREKLYHSPVVFDLNYEEMFSKFKIFIYPSNEHSFQVFSVDDVIFTDDLLVYHLYQSQFVTLDAEAAHLLFLPVSVRNLSNDPSIGPGKTGKHLNKFIQKIRDGYPYWSRTLGADHVLVTCHEAKEDGSRNVLELKKNAIQVTCSPLAGNGKQVFYPHKDIAMPLFQVAQLPPSDGEVERSTLVYYHGPTDAASLYASLGVSWESDPAFAFESKDVEPAIHYQRLATSKFCLILAPQDYPDIVSSLRFGCVPVLVSDGKLYDLPFQDVLNWSQFAVVVSLKNAKKVKNLISALTEDQYTGMQCVAKEASKHLEWHSPPRDRDAFFMVLYDLWVRRHAIRYVRRDEL